MTMRPATEVEKKAIGLYAVIARDPLDFIDMMREEESMEVLELLMKMFTTPNPEHDADTVDLNKTGADLVRNEIDRRTLPRPYLR